MPLLHCLILAIRGRSTSDAVAGLVGVFMRMLRYAGPHMEDFDVKVGGVAGEVALGPTPVGVYYDEADYMPERCKEEVTV